MTSPCASDVSSPFNDFYYEKSSLSPFFEELKQSIDYERIEASEPEKIETTTYNFFKSRDGLSTEVSTITEVKSREDLLQSVEQKAFDSFQNSFECAVCKTLSISKYTHPLLTAPSLVNSDLCGECYKDFSKNFSKKTDNPEVNLERFREHRIRKLEKREKKARRNQFMAQFTSPQNTINKSVPNLYGDFSVTLPLNFNPINLPPSSPVAPKKECNVCGTNEKITRLGPKNILGKRPSLCVNCETSYTTNFKKNGIDTDFETFRIWRTVNLQIKRARIEKKGKTESSYSE